MNHSIMIIGAGKLGTSLFRALKETGFPFVTLVGNKPFSKMDGTFLDRNDYSPVLTDTLIRKHSFIFICVKDGQIRPLADTLLHFDISNRMICHTSGALTSQILEPMKDKGAKTGSFHPMQTFSGAFSTPDVWNSVCCTYEGDAEPLSLLEGLCKKFKAHLLHISADQKLRLHLAAALVSNYGVALISWAESVLQNTEFDTNKIKTLLLPLLRTVVDHYAEQDVHELLTGPLQRGDLGILEKHLSLLNGTGKKLYLDFAQFLTENRHFEIRNRELLKDFIHANRN